MRQNPERKQSPPPIVMSGAPEEINAAFSHLVMRIVAVESEVALLRDELFTLRHQKNV